jgi:hypothetical protein
MVEGRKQAISLRVSSSDLHKVKRLAQRLGARDSDVIRFAVKTTLARLAPLCDGSLKGDALVSVFVESGFDFFRHFDLDAVRLDSIINEGVDDAHRIKPEDIQLIALNGIQQAYARLGLRDKQPDPAEKSP